MASNYVDSHVNNYITEYVSEYLFTDTIAVNMSKIKIIHK